MEKKVNEAQIKINKNSFKPTCKWGQHGADSWDSAYKYFRPY